MQSDFQDRLAGEKYRDDVECEVRLEPNPKDESGEPMVASISEKLLDRLRNLGVAYELPLLARLPGSGSTWYPEVQLGSLEDELAFLFNIVSDPALLAAVSPVREMIERATHHPRGWSLVIEAP